MTDPQSVGNAREPQGQEPPLGQRLLLAALVLVLGAAARLPVPSLPLMAEGSVLATAGGLVFAGDVNCSFMAFDDATGEILWRTMLDDQPSSNIVSYSVDGKQYVAVVVGAHNYHVDGWTRTYLGAAEELDMPVNDSPLGGGAVWVFALGQ